MVQPKMVVCLKCLLLRDHPEIDVNWVCPNSDRWTSLHAASCFGHVESVKLLLAHPNINVYLKDSNGQTPLSLACCGRVSVVRLLKDPRVDIALHDNSGRTVVGILFWEA